MSRRAEFERVYEQHLREVWAVAYARRLDTQLALDVAQEAFLRLWRAWQTGEMIEHPRAWLLRVARNLAEDSAKGAFRRHGTHAPEQLTHLPGSSPDGTPLDQLIDRERHATVRAVLQELPSSDRDILTLKYALDYDVERIAELLGIQPSAVHMRLSRARQRLAERLTREIGS